MMTAYQEATSLSPCKGILVVDGLNVIHEWTKHLPPGSPHLSKIIMTVFELFGDIQKNQLGQPMASVVVDRRDPIITDLEIMQWQRHGFQIVDSKSILESSLFSSNNFPSDKGFVNSLFIPLVIFLPYILTIVDSSNN